MNRTSRNFKYTLLLLPFITGCAFFNALYNGWQAFDSGMKTEEKMYRSGSDTTEVRKATESDYIRAIQKAEKAVSYYPKSHRTHDDAFFLKGRTLYQMGNYAEAVPIFKTLQGSYPDSKRIPESWLFLAMCYAGSGDYPMADETYTYVIENYPQLNKNQEVLILRADLAIMMQGKSQAIGFLTDALERINDPERKIYLIDRLAGLYIDLSMHDKALEYIVQKPSFDKSYKDLYYDVSLKEIECYSELTEHQKAEELLLSLIESRHYIVHHAPLRLELSILYLNQQRINEAKEILLDLTASTKTDSTVAQSWYELSRIQIDIENDLPEGKKSLTEVLAMSISNELRAMAQRRLDGLNKIELYNDSLSGGIPDTVSEGFVRFLLGEQYWLDAQLPDSALKEFETILADTTASDTILAKVLYSKGWILQEVKGDTILAVPVLEQVISDYPEFEEAKEAQRLLGKAITIQVRRDSAEVKFLEAEKLRLSTKGYSKDVYYSYLITALKYPDIKDIAAKSLYAAGYVVNNREGSITDVDTAAAKIYGRLCRDYPESEQCKDAQSMLENGKVKGFVDSYTKFLEEKGKEEVEDSTALANDTEEIISEDAPLVIPDFSDWF